MCVCVAKSRDCTCRAASINLQRCDYLLDSGISVSADQSPAAAPLAALVAVVVVLQLLGFEEYFNEFKILGVSGSVWPRVRAASVEAQPRVLACSCCWSCADRDDDRWCRRTVAAVVGSLHRLLILADDHGVTASHASRSCGRGHGLCGLVQMCQWIANPCPCFVVADVSIHGHQTPPRMSNPLQ